MRPSFRFASLALLPAAALGAQQPQQQPKHRSLGATVASSKDSIGTVSQVRQLPGGRVLVNDAATRRVLMLDSTLAVIGVVADSTSATANAYASRSGSLIPYRGDSTLFVDPQSMSMLVFDPTGKNVRTMSVPRSQDAFSLTMAGTGFDAAGRLVYRSMPAMMMRGAPGAAGGPMSPPSIPDSAAIVRIDLATRKVDTVAHIKTPKVNMQMTQNEGGRITMQSQINPLPQADDWAVLADGSIGIVRARDYHVDLVNADGSITSAPKVPFDWQRLTDEDKVALIDSVKAARERMMASAPAGGGNPAMAGAMAGMTVTRFEMSGAAAGEPRRRGDGSTPPPSGTAAGPSFSAPQITFVPPSELPDYKPPFFPGSVRADADGNLWVRTVPTRIVPGGPIYDVINRKGELVERVQVPADRTIVGFGAGGVVYLASRDAAVGTRLERARVR
jgi:hypothetical protein